MIYQTKNVTQREYPPDPLFPQKMTRGRDLQDLSRLIFLQQQSTRKKITPALYL